MQNIDTLFEYIKNNYEKYEEIQCREKAIVIVFHDEFKMKIHLQGFFKIYFNDIFYYDVDGQDIKDTIDDLFTNQYIICERKNKIKILDVKEFDNTLYNHAWTIERTLK